MSSWITITPGTVSWITPCHTRNPASVTTNDGTPISATNDPWSAPIAVVARIAAAMQTHHVRSEPVGILQLGGDHSGDPAHEGDREVDLADEKDEDDAVGEEAGPRHLRDQVREVGGCPEVGRRLPEDGDDNPEREDHRPAPEVAGLEVVLEPLPERFLLQGLDLGSSSDRHYAPAPAFVDAIPATLVGVPAVMACTTSCCVVLARS